MVDIHTHILYGMDDGARSLDEALCMCAEAANNHITALVATPHFADFDEIDDFIARRDTRLSALVEAADDQYLPLRLHGGAEVRISSKMRNQKDAIRRLTLAGSRYLLTEIPFAPIPVDEIFACVEAVLDAGLIPVIAHPERMELLIEDYGIVNDLRNMGAAFQVTAGTFAGAFGTPARRLAQTMLDADLIDCLATDAHEPFGPRGVHVLGIMNRLVQIIPEHQLRRMMEETPGEIIADQDISPRATAPVRPRRYRLF